jgi:hypothetical protein
MLRMDQVHKPFRCLALRESSRFPERSTDFFRPEHLGARASRRPETLKKSPAPLFHAASRKLRQELYEAYKYFVAAFKDAAARLRAGEVEVLFPPGCFPPVSPWVSG